MHHRARLALLLLPLLASGGALPQSAGAPGSPACQRALDTLDAREGAATKDRSARGALEAARREAAVACLGGRDAPASAPLRAAQPSVTTPLSPLRPPAASPPAAALPAPVPRAAAPVVITACDATGCWASDGSRLQRAGPNLLGPKGLCTTSGSLLQCPP